MEKKKTFLKIFLGIALSMLLVILLAFGSIYGNVKNIIIDQNIQLSMQAFGQVKSEVEDANQVANTIATQVVLDGVCSEFLNSMSGKNLNSMELNRVRSQLSIYENTNSVVKSIYIYNSALDLFVTSGYRNRAVGKAEFTDRSLAELLETPEVYGNHKLIRREMLTKYPNQLDKQETVYSYILAVPPKELGNVVVINMKFDSLFEEILQMEMMKDSRMVIVDDDLERLMEFQTLPVEVTEEVRAEMIAMVERNQPYMECVLNGEKYFISALHSEDSSWNYAKATKWDTMFASLLEVRSWMLVFFAVTVVGILLIAIGIAFSMLRMHGKIEKKYAQSATKIKKSDMNVLRDGFLSDFLHGRKLFGKKHLSQEMEKFGLSVEENQKFAIAILKLEAYDRFLELFGKKEAYDIKYGFQNVFAETFEKEFKSVSLINRDDTITFILKTEDEERLTERIDCCFREFLTNVKVFVEWNFMLFGSEKTVAFERLPELNAELKKVLSEGFFYPTNTFQTCEKLQEEHCRKTDLQEIDGECLTRLLKMDKDVKETYVELISQMKNSRMSEYMNIMIWLGITISRNKKQFALSSQEGSEFLVRLSKCEKDSEADALFFRIFDKMQQKQEKAGAKKGVSGRLSEVKLYIEENFRDANLTLEQLGEEFSVSPNYLGQLFKKEMGVSISDYISNERLNWVMQELSGTNRSAKEIAEEAGFVNSNYFYTYFKKKVGMTPQAYREQFLESSEETAEN